MELNPKAQRIGEILLEHGLLRKQDLDAALKVQKKNGGLIGVILVDKGYVKEEDLAFALAQQFNYPYLSLENITVNKNLFKEFGKDFLLENGFVPIEKTRDVLTIAAADPSDEGAIEKIKNKARVGVLAFVTGVKQIEELIERVFSGMLKETKVDPGKSDAILKKATEEKLKEKK